MQASPEVLHVLNDNLTTELTSINRYFLHARMFKNWGFSQLNDMAYKKSIKDMKQADILIERILFLEGLPNLQKLELLQVGESAEKMIACDVNFQRTQSDKLRQGIAVCESLSDYVSREILTKILEYEEEYLDLLEIQQHQISEVSLQNYLQKKI